MATLRKSDLSGQVASKLGGSRAQGEAALKAVLDSIQESLSGGNRVVLTGFGSFEVRQVKARKVRPIRGGQAGNLITVPAHKRVGFTAGAELSKAAQGGR
jgi:DNA-binding protein HU-beta